MRPALPLSILALSVLLGVNRCRPVEETPPATSWYTTCGDPVCGEYRGPFAGVPECTTEEEGEECAAAGQTCDPVNDCNAYLICAEEDPKDQTGGCPISRKRHKTDIRYLDNDGRKSAAEELFSVRLAEWRYQWDKPDRRPHLGFLIDDAPLSPAVTEDGEHVDLYGYTSLTVAALQEERAARLLLQAEVSTQAAELRSLRAELDALKEGLEASKKETASAR